MITQIGPGTLPAWNTNAQAQEQQLEQQQQTQAHCQVHSIPPSSTPNPKTIRDLITSTKSNSGLDFSITKGIKLGFRDSPKIYGNPFQQTALPWY